MVNKWWIKHWLYLTNRLIMLIAVKSFKKCSPHFYLQNNEIWQYISTFINSLHQLSLSLFYSLKDLQITAGLQRHKTFAWKMFLKLMKKWLKQRWLKPQRTKPSIITASRSVYNYSNWALWINCTLWMNTCSSPHLTIYPVIGMTFLIPEQMYAKTAQSYINTSICNRAVVKIVRHGYCF